MNAIKNILVPTDFSEISKEAIDYACELAQMHGATLHIIHVFEEPAFPSFYEAGALVLYGKVPDIRNQTQEALDQLKTKLNNNLTVKTDLLDGHAAGQICAYAEANAVDLIVIPTYGLRGFKHVLLGSVAERVVREANCPVFVYKNKKQMSAGG